MPEPNEAVEDGGRMPVEVEDGSAAPTEAGSMTEDPGGSRAACPMGKGHEATIATACPGVRDGMPCSEPGARCSYYSPVIMSEAVR
jgi:hypothetical protein